MHGVWIRISDKKHCILTYCRQRPGLSIFLSFFPHSNLCVWKINVLFRIASFMHEECCVLLWTCTWVNCTNILPSLQLYAPVHITGDVLTYCNIHWFCISLQSIQISTGQAYCICTQLMFFQPFFLKFLFFVTSPAVSLDCILWWWPQC